MDVINKLYSSVSSTVSQLSGVLPGNPVTREYEATEHIASAGPGTYTYILTLGLSLIVVFIVGLLWKIYRGYKKSTKQACSIFLLEKKQLDHLAKDEKEYILDTMKRGITQLTKIRHPNVLTVQHPLEESRESLAFAAESVFSSLSNLLDKDCNNMPQPIPKGIANYKLYDVEIKYGLQQISEGLIFLHNDMKMLHRNVQPECIVVNHIGAWKLFGFEYSLIGPEIAYKEYNTYVNKLNEPSLKYMAPECHLIKKISHASDIYSLGVLCFELSRKSKSDTSGTLKTKIFNSIKTYEDYKKFAMSLKRGDAKLDLSLVDDTLRDYVKLMLHHTPEMRPELHDFIKIPYFDDIGVKTLSYLDSMFQWDNLQKSKFYKGLPQILQKLPPRICIYRVLPSLVKEFVNPHMVPFVLPNILLIAEICCNREDFSRHILKHLKPIMKLQEPIQILLIFMQKMELLLKLTPPEDVKSDVLPMLYRALEPSSTQQIQELCLTVLPTFSSLIEYSAMKNSVLPRIKKICTNTDQLSLRVNCLLCLGKLLGDLDKWLVHDEVLQYLPTLNSREPAVVMGILGIYKLALTHNKLGISKELLASKIIPFLVPLSIENGLSLNQFEAVTSLIQEMVTKVTTEQREKLKQIHGLKNETKSFDMSMLTQSNTLVPTNLEPKTKESDKTFANLGLDDYLMSMESLADNTESKNGTTSLTLKDKQRIVTQQELTHQLRTQPPILQPQPQPQPQKPQNTSNLMDSNLPLFNQQQPNYNYNNTWTNKNQNFTPFQKSTPNYNISIGPDVFDNLLTSPTNANTKVPMNSMMTTTTVNQNYLMKTNNVKETKSLTKEDIFDLLS